MSAKLQFVARSKLSPPKLSDKLKFVGHSWLQNYPKRGNARQVIANNRIFSRYQRITRTQFHKNLVAAQARQHPDRRLDNFFRGDRKPRHSSLSDGCDSSGAMPRRQPNQKRRMRARSLIGEQKPPRRRSGQDCRCMLAFQFDVTHSIGLRHLLRVQRRVSLFERQRHELILLIEDIDKFAIRWRSRQKFLSEGGACKTTEKES